MPEGKGNMMQELIHRHRTLLNVLCNMFYNVYMFVGCPPMDQNSQEETPGR